MDYMDSIGELGDIHDPVGIGIVANANFSDALAYCGHRFPVIRIQTVLNLINLVTGFTSGG